MAVILACAGVVLLLGRSSASDQGMPAVPAEPFATVWTERSVALLGIGDSITAGFGATPGYAYFDRLVQAPAGESPDMQGRTLAAVFPHLTPENRAVSSTVSTEHLDTQIANLPIRPADVFGVVVMTTGGNDIIHNYGETPPRECAMFGATLAQAGPWIDNFRDRLDRMMDLLREKFPGGCAVFLANIYDPSDGTGDLSAKGLPAWPDGVAVLAAYNQVIVECAARYDFVHLVDIHAVFMGHGFRIPEGWGPNAQRSGAPCWYHANIEDPNDMGYDAIRRLVLTEMIRVLGQGLPKAVR